MRPIRLLAISASPRAHGNSQFLLDLALEEAEKSVFPVNVEMISFSGEKIAPCISCLQCKKNGGNCIIKDDFQAIHQFWLEADCVIYSTPVYVAGIPGQLKCFIDRQNNSELGLYPVRCQRHMKAIGVIAQGGDFPGGQEYAMFDIMRHAAMTSSLYVAPDGYFFGSGGWAGSGSTGKEMERKISEGRPEMTETMKTARTTVKRVIETAALLMQGALDHREKLEKDPLYAAYYQRIDADK